MSKVSKQASGNPKTNWIKSKLLLSIRSLFFLWLFWVNIVYLSIITAVFNRKTAPIRSYIVSHQFRLRLPIEYIPEIQFLKYYMSATELITSRGWLFDFLIKILLTQLYGRSRDFFNKWTWNRSFPASLMERHQLRRNQNSVNSNAF